MSKKQRKTDPCHCGSGTQFRYCHGAPQEVEEEAPLTQRNPRRVFLFLVLVLSPLAVLASFSQGQPEDTVNRVWSPEHGHYHTLDGREIGAAAAAPQAAAVDGEPAAPSGDAPDPTVAPGPAPPGKVWSPEHGHWHDADPEAGADPLQNEPWDHQYRIERPDGPPPEGMTWSESHGHWHPSDGG